MFVTVLTSLTGILGAVLFSTAIFKRRPTQAALACLMLLAIIPAVFMNSGGILQIDRSMLVIAATGSNAAVDRFMQRLPAGTHVSLLRLSTSDLAMEPPTELKWKPAGDFTANALGRVPQLPAQEGWLTQAADLTTKSKATAFTSWFRKPSVVVLHDSNDTWTNIDGIGRSVRFDQDLATLVQNGVELLFVDCQNAAFASGRLAVALDAQYLPTTGSVDVNGNREEIVSLQNSPAEVRLELRNCPFVPTDGTYSITGWIDRNVLTGNAVAVLNGSNDGIKRPGTTSVHAAPSALIIETADVDEPRRTVLKMSNFKPIGGNSADLRTGMHLLEVEIKFSGNLGGQETPLLYRASTYFEVATVNLVALDCSSPSGLTIPTWIHRSMPGGPTGPPLPIELLNNLSNPVNRILYGNSRFPFGIQQNAHMADRNSGNIPTLSLLAEELKSASEFVLIEPSWEVIKKLEEASSPINIGEWVENGGTLVIIGPPDIPATASIPSWLIAKVDTAQRNRLSFEPRVYIVPDVSRPGSWFRTESGNRTGADLQKEVINKVYSHFRVSPRGDDPPSSATTIAAVDNLGGNLTMKPKFNVVCIGRSNAGEVLFVPPVFARPSVKDPAVTTEYRQGPAQGALNDLFGGWVESRLWVVSAIARTDLVKPNRPLATLGTPIAPNVAPQMMDLPLHQEQSSYFGSVVVVFALEAKQPKDIRQISALSQLTVWSDQSPPTITLDNPGSLTISELKASGVSVIVVPIKIHDDYFAAGTDFEYVTKDGIIPGASFHKLAEQAATSGSELLSTGLDLRSNDSAATKSADAVAAELITQIERRVKNAYSAEILDPVRALDLRVHPPSVPRRVQRLTDADPATTGKLAQHTTAQISNGTDQIPLAAYQTLGRGSIHILAYSPFAYDRWSHDRGSMYWPDVPTNGTRAGFSSKLRSHGYPDSSYDGWGLQRLIDPITLRAKSPVSGLRIRSAALTEDRSFLNLCCQLPLHDSPTPVVTRVDPSSDSIVPSVLGIDVDSREIEFSINGGAVGIGEVVTVELGSEQKNLFVSLAPVNPVGGSSKEILERISVLSGGGTTGETDVEPLLQSSVSMTRFGAVSVFLIVMIAMSPLVRRWSPLLIRKRQGVVDDSISVDDDAADIEAAFNQSGMNPGEPKAQRPAGRIMQLRQMRGGDPPLAARRSDWGYFAEDVEKLLGSPLLPKVFETPSTEATSILTLLDLHPGAFANDDGSREDRQRAMVRICGMNIEIAKRRGGVHRLASLQRSQPNDLTYCMEIEEVIERLPHLSSFNRFHELPDVEHNETVVLVTDVCANTGAYLTDLCAKVAESGGRFVIVVLQDKRQLKELGPVSINGIGASFDRSMMEESDLEIFHADRLSEISDRGSTIDAACVKIWSDQPSTEVVSLLGELVCFKQ